MKIITTAAIAAVALSLGACNATNEDAAAEANVQAADDLSDSYEAAADNATTEGQEQMLENQADMVENTMEAPAEAADAMDQNAM